MRLMLATVVLAEVLAVSGYGSTPDSPVLVAAESTCGRCFQQFVIHPPFSRSDATVHWLPDGFNAITLTTGKSGRCFNWSSTLGIDQGLVESTGSIANRYDYTPEAMRGTHLNASNHPDSCEESDIARIRFCFDLEQYGCVRGPEYWKTHSAYGPEEFDSTWDLLADSADTLFHLSGQTFLEVLRTVAQNGNAYYTLAHQYIAALLNTHAGAAVPESIGYSLEDAHALFDTFLPADIGDLAPQNELLHTFLDIALILEDFNRGYQNVPDCECYSTH